MSDVPGGYVVSCHNCQGSFDAIDASWCSCLVAERTLSCPTCLQCFCRAPAAYKSRFWSGAPRAVWDRKFSEHHADFTPAANPALDAVTRPLILVVEDEQDIRRIALRTIASLGYSVLVGRNGEEGLALARQYQPDLVISDALMPRLDGREMSRQLKQDAATAKIPVVLMTSVFTSPKYDTEARKAFKVDDYLKKPIDFNQLRQVIEKHLG